MKDLFFGRGTTTRKLGSPDLLKGRQVWRRKGTGTATGKEGFIGTERVFLGEEQA